MIGSSDFNWKSELGLGGAVAFTWPPCYGHTMKMSNKNCKCKTQTTCTKKQQETWWMHAPFSWRAALAVKNASVNSVNILQLNVEGMTSSKLNIIEQLVSNMQFDSFSFKKPTAPMQLN